MILIVVVEYAVHVFFFVFFFFQAEDGIRDLVRSRGLGDVYKRQSQSGPSRVDRLPHNHRSRDGRGYQQCRDRHEVE